VRKIAVVSHTPIDQIQSNGIDTVTVGGPTCYSGLTIKSLSHDVHIITKIGTDFDFKDMLSRKGLTITDNAVSDKPTTRFKIVIDGNQRKLFLLARCADITVGDIDTDADACIVSPVINEVSVDVILEMSKRTSFLFLDPQGFVRKVRDDGSCYIDKTTMDLSKLKIDAIKVDSEEGFALTAMHDIDALYKLPAKTKIMTINNRTLMFHNQHLYEITADMVDTKDSTGAGDILAGAYTAVYAETNEAQWALCYGVAAAAIALRTNKVGLEKIPNKTDIEEYASVLQNRLRTLVA
jgi:sugar/nucleoside kinase (ribokinase family)